MIFNLQMRAPPRQQEQEFYFDRAPERFYEDDSYYKEESRNDYKQSSAREVHSCYLVYPPG